MGGTRMGWTGKDFEVVSWSLVIEEDAANAPLLGVDLGLRETATTVYDWASGEETLIDPAPNTTLPDPFVVAPPTSLVLTSGTAALFLKIDGTVVSRIKVNWTAPADQPFSLVLPYAPTTIVPSLIATSTPNLSSSAPSEASSLVSQTHVEASGCKRKT